MQSQYVLYYVLWAGLFFVMMRYGCGAHIMGHGHHHGARLPDQAPGTGTPSIVPVEAIDPVCGMTVQASTAKTAAFQGQVYYFCSQKCREKFEASPEPFLKSMRGTSSAMEHQHG